MTSDDPAGKPRPFNVGVTFNHDLYDLGEAVFKTRAIQAFESVATRYPIHRLVRCAVPRALQDVFDDLALNAGLAAQRLESGTLLLDGPGVFVHAEGKRKARLGVAEYYAKMPKAQRKRTMVFIGLDGHHNGATGGVGRRWLVENSSRSLLRRPL